MLSMILCALCVLLLCACVQFTNSGASPKTYGMCFGSPADWNKFGNPGDSLWP